VRGSFNPSNTHFRADVFELSEAGRILLLGAMDFDHQLVKQYLNVIQEQEGGGSDDDEDDDNDNDSDSEEEKESSDGEEDSSEGEHDPPYTGISVCSLSL
jgi:hypothetical protein